MGSLFHLLGASKQKAQPQERARLVHGASTKLIMMTQRLNKCKFADGFLKILWPVSQMALGVRYRDLKILIFLKERQASVGLEDESLYEHDSVD